MIDGSSERSSVENPIEIPKVQIDCGGANLMKRVFQAILIIIVLAVMVFGFFIWTIRSSFPTQGEESPMADKLARYIQKNLNREAWKQTGAIFWEKDEHEVLWDLERGLIRVRFHKNPNNQKYQHEAFFDFQQTKKKVFENTTELVDVDHLYREAYALWLQDLIIIEPSHTFFLRNVRRFYIPEAGQKIGSLLVQYNDLLGRSGDTYQFFVNANGEPVKTKMWSNTRPNFYGLKISGLTMSWEKWVTVATGLKVSTFHKIGDFFSYPIKINTALTLKALIGQDPFVVLSPDPLDPPPPGQPNEMDENQEYIEANEINPLTF